MTERPRIPATGSAAEAAPVGFLGWGPGNAVLHRLLDAAPGGATRAMRIHAPARGESPPGSLPVASSVEALLAPPGVVFVDLPAADWHAVLPALRLAISDRNVIVLAGHGVSMTAALSHLHERKLIRCVVTPHQQPGEAILAFNPSRWARAGDADAFRTMFPHLARVLELRDERAFDVVRALSGIAPAVLYTLADAFADGALMMGLPRDQAMPFLSGVFLGAARAMTSGEHPALLREGVLKAEPAAAGLMELESAGVRGLMMRVIEQAVQQVRRSDESGVKYDSARSEE